ncbi:unnamed protein product, partial [Polarella glacialis]
MLCAPLNLGLLLLLLLCAGAATALAPAEEAEEKCPSVWGFCLKHKCCTSPELTCYEKDRWYAQCRPTGNCEPGFHHEDPRETTPWSCVVLSSPTLPPPSTEPPTTNMPPTTTTAKTTTTTTTAPPSPTLPPPNTEPPTTTMPPTTTTAKTTTTTTAITTTTATATTTANTTTTTTATTATTPPSLECVDKDRLCADWARAGECDRNAGHMHEYCMKSCNLCGKVPFGKLSLWPKKVDAIIRARCGYADWELGGLSSPAAQMYHIRAGEYCGASPDLFLDGNECGACYRLWKYGAGNAGKSAIVQIIDANTAPSQTFDCHPAAFSKITGAANGSFQVAY